MNETIQKLSKNAGIFAGVFLLVLFVYFLAGTSDVEQIALRCFEYLMRLRTSKIVAGIVIGAFLFVVFLGYFAGIKTRKIIAEILPVILLLIFLLFFSILIVALTFAFPVFRIIITGFCWLLLVVFLEYFAGIKVHNISVGIFPKVFLFFFLLYFSGPVVQTTFYSFPTLGGGKIARGITKEKILSLKPGMDKDMAISILGEPIRTDRPFVRYPNGERRYPFGDDHSLIYATPGFLGAGFEMFLYINDNKLSVIKIVRNRELIYLYSQNFKHPNSISREDLEKLFSLSSK